jgi:hypothetical protein
VIERARTLLAVSESVSGHAQKRVLAQIDILFGQARLIRLSILLASASLLSAACLIIVLFITALFKIEDAWLVSILFVTCLLSLIGSLLAFITDINRSLSAFKVELYDRQAMKDV